MSNESNNIFRVRFTKKEVFWGLLICFLYASLKNFYLIKFRHYHGADTLDLITKYIYTFSRVSIGFILYKLNHLFLSKFVFIACILSISDNFFIPLIARNATILDLDTRQNIMYYDNVFKIFNGSFYFVSFSYTITLLSKIFKNTVLESKEFFYKHLKNIIMICLFFTALIYFSGQLREDTFVLFQFFKNDITLKKFLYTLTLSILFIPFYQIIAKMILMNGFINIRILFLNFAMLSIISSSIVVLLLGNNIIKSGSVSSSFAYSFLFLFSSLVISLKDYFLLKYILQGILKYAVLFFSINSFVYLIVFQNKKIYDPMLIHAFIGIFFSLTLIYIYHKHYKTLSIKKIT